LTEVDIAVVGAGLAGLNAALQAARLGRPCAAFTGDVAGGQLLSIESIQDLPGHPDGIPGYDLIPMMQELLMDAGAKCLPELASGLERDADAWVVRGPSDAVRARCVILAPGSRLRNIGVPGERELAGHGVSHCASCDAPLLRGRQVAVVGGGDSACQEALTLAAHAAQVYLLVRGAALRAQAYWQRRVEEQRNISRRLQTTVAAIVGEDAVRAVQLVGAGAEADGELAVDGVFIYAGLVPDTGFLDGVAPLDPEGRLVVDAALRSPVPGLFGAGTARAANSGQAAGAAADGQAAAWAAHRYLDGEVWPA
jgi:thioredoxin reductase (NADPH)